MSRFYISMLACAMVLVGNVRAVGDPTVTGDAQTELAAEWSDVTYGFPKCLASLDLLTQPSPNPDEALRLLEGADAVSAAADEAAKKSPADAGSAKAAKAAKDSAAKAHAIYPLAERMGKLADLLAKAFTAPAGFQADSRKGVAEQFKAAGDALKVLYDRNPARLYDEVDQQYLKNEPRAFYNLLALENSQNASLGAATVAANASTFRLCYSADDAQLFALIHAFFM